MTKKKKDMLFYAAVCAIPLAQFILFYVIVNINSIVMAFQEYKVVGDRGDYIWAGFKNFRGLVENYTNFDIFPTALKNTFLAFFTSVFVGIFLSLIFSYYIAKKMLLSSSFKFMLFVPSIISSVVVILLFKYFSENALPAAINKIFKTEMEGFIGSKDTALATILFFNVWIGFGTMILMFSGAMSDVDNSIIEAAGLDGANQFQEFFFIFLPMIYPTIVTFLVVNVAGLFGNQMGLYSFFGSASEPYLWTIGYWLFKDTKNAALPDYCQLAAAGVVLTIVSTPLTLIVKRVLEKYGPSEE